MALKRSILLHGLRLTLRKPGAFLWTYAANLGLALLFSVRLHAQFADLLSNSLASERLTSAFDLGVASAALERFSRHTLSAGATPYFGIPVYLLLYFLIVPGTLFCYAVDAPARLGTLLSSGLSFFWRFVRITLLALIVSGLILGPLFALQGLWSKHVEENVVGVSQTLHRLAGMFLILLVAAVLRLYFDLVEVYTVQIGQQTRPNGKPDRRVRRTLLPALRTLGRNFLRGYVTFLLLLAFGLAAVFFTGRIAIHMLAQPRVWPMFLLAQLGFLLMLFSRCWQRGAETVLAFDHPLLPPPFNQQRPTPSNPRRHLL